MSASEAIILGHISGVFGIKGWVKVFSYTRPREQILNYPKWFVGDDTNSQMALEQGRLHKESIIVKLEGIDDRDQAMALFESNIRVLISELVELPADEFYWYQLIGLQVVDTAQQPIGEVVRLLETGANDVLVVHDANNVEHLIPYIKDQVVQRIDLTTKEMIVDWDTNY